MSETATLIRDARIVDGTGAPWCLGEVLVRDGRIDAVGPAIDAGRAAGAEVLEAGGRYLAPGFIDTHTHDDLICLRQRDRAEKIAQGVTTVVVGNCSFGLFPEPAVSRPLLHDHCEGLLGPLKAEESFEDFAAYRRALEVEGIALNVISLVGHSALRLAVVGWDNRPATAAELDAMGELLDAQLAEGAAGLSLGLVYPPGAWADRSELLRLAEVTAAREGLLAAHIRSYEGGLLASVEEFLDLLRNSGARGLLSHLQAAGKPYWGSIPEAIGKLEAARREGIDVSFDMYPYQAGSSTILQLVPPSAQDGGVAALLGRLGDPDSLAALRRAVEAGEAPGDPGWESKVLLIGWENVVVSGVTAPELVELEGRSLLAIAEERSEEPFDTLVWLLAADKAGTNMVMFQLDDGDLCDALRHPLHMLGSDGIPRESGKPHPRAFGAFPRYIAHCAIERGWFGIEEAVRHMTAVPAMRFGLADRGLVRPGMIADLVLFGDDIADTATFTEPRRSDSGIRDVMVAGTFLLRDGTPTGKRPGRVLTPGEARGR